MAWPWGLSRQKKNSMMKMANVRNFMRKTFKFGLFIPLSNLILTYGSRYLPSRLLRRMADKRTIKIQRIIVDVVGFGAINAPVSTDDFCRNDVIWFCWMQGEEALPPVPKLCLASLIKHSGGRKVVFLDKNNYGKYVSIPQWIIDMYRSGKIKQAHFADIMRVMLLSQKGGLWIDATLLVTKDLPAEIFDMPFFSIKTDEFGYFVSRCRWSVFCLAGWRNSILFKKVARLFEAYLSKTCTFVDYFMFDHFIDILYKNDSSIRQMIDAVPMNNANVHDLNRLLCDDFDARRYDELTADGTYMFKLSWKTYTEEQLRSNPRSYYNYLLKNL